MPVPQTSLQQKIPGAFSLSCGGQEASLRCGLGSLEVSVLPVAVKFHTLQGEA